MCTLERNWHIRAAQHLFMEVFPVIIRYVLCFCFLKYSDNILLTVSGHHVTVHNAYSLYCKFPFHNVNCVCITLLCHSSDYCYMGPVDCNHVEERSWHKRAVQHLFMEVFPVIIRYVMCFTILFTLFYLLLVVCMCNSHTVHNAWLSLRKLASLGP